MLVFRKFAGSRFGEPSIFPIPFSHPPNSLPASPIILFSVFSKTLRSSLIHSFAPWRLKNMSRKYRAASFPA